MFADKEDLGYIVNTILDGAAKQVSVILDKKHVIKGTLRSSSRQRRSKEIVLTLGRPNYYHRQVIRKAQKSGEPFPLVIESLSPQR